MNATCIELPDMHDCPPPPSWAVSADDKPLHPALTVIEGEQGRREGPLGEAWGGPGGPKRGEQRF